MLLTCTLSGVTFLCLSDLHINSERLTDVKELLRQVSNKSIAGVLLLGDIADFGSAKLVIDELQGGLPFPIYYILGNHDYYGHWIDLVRHAHKSDAYFSTRTSPLSISSTSCIIGHDGWADGRIGDFLSSNIILRDSFEIFDLKGLNKNEYFERINDLSREAADHVLSQLQHAYASGVRQVLIVTHIPPFLEACLYEGIVADSNWAPHFVSKAMGDMLREFFKGHSDLNGLVLAGHTHHPAAVQILPNLQVRVLSASCENMTFEEVQYEL